MTYGGGTHKMIVRPHKKGWAVVKQLVGGYMHGATTVISIHKTKQEAQQAAGIDKDR